LNIRPNTAVPQGASLSQTVSPLATTAILTSRRNVIQEKLKMLGATKPYILTKEAREVIVEAVGYLQTIDVYGPDEEGKIMLLEDALNVHYDVLSA